MADSNTGSQNETGKEPRPGPVRDWLALGVTFLSILIIFVLAKDVLLLAAGDFDKAQSVLNVILPVVASWVGTVLAYYFSRENLESAARAVQSMAKQVTAFQKLQGIPVKEKMVTKAQLFFKTLPATGIKLAEILDELEKLQKGNRIPVLDQNGCPAYVIHRSAIDKFVAQQARAGVPIDQLTLDNLLKDPKYKSLESSFALVKEDATLADAKAAMEGIPHCQDVFVTKTGNRKEEVLGLITNVIIQENSKV